MPIIKRLTELFSPDGFAFGEPRGCGGVRLGFGLFWAWDAIEN
jgi:hypothetical protein